MSMASSRPLPPPEKPLLRGHFHQAAVFISIGACAVLISRCTGLTATLSLLIYSLSLVGLFGISAFYHRLSWKPSARLWMRRLDHSAIFLLIAGTSTPIATLALDNPQSTTRMLFIIWSAAAIGILQSLFWILAPKWVAPLLCVSAGWLVFPYISEITAHLSALQSSFFLIGGAIYSIGAIVYALKWPNPKPRIFGYHEIFHILTIVAAAFHFIVVASLIN